MLLLLKLTLGPCLVALAYLAGRRWGLKVSGWLVAFPIIAGPILLFLSLEQGPLFGAEAAKKTLLGLAGFSAFVLAYSRAASRLGVAGSLLCGWLAYLAAAALVSHLSLPLGADFALGFSALIVAWSLLPRISGAPGRLAEGKPAVELGLRMAAAAAMILGLTGAARLLGPDWSGVLTPFPVATSILAGFAQARGGARAAVHFLAGAMGGMLTFACFCLVLSGALIRFAVLPAFGLALLALLPAQGILLWMVNLSGRTAKS